MILDYRKLQGQSGHQAGRQLLREMYEGLRGKPMPPVLLTERGKPYFRDDPLYFSITHTKRHVFCALSETPVGIDGEEMDRRVNLHLADKILSPGERARYDRAADSRLCLLRLWVLKEAYVKMLGTGLTGYPNQTDFDPDDSRIREIDGCLLAVLQQSEF